MVKREVVRCRMPCQHCSMFIAESAILLGLQATSTSQVGLIVISKCLKRHSQEKRRAPAYSRALHQLRGVVQTIVHERLKSGCQRKQNRRQSPQPTYLCELFTIQPTCSTRSSSCFTLSRPPVASHLVFSSRAISIIALRFWNDLPPELRTISLPPAPSLPITRHHLHPPILSVTHGPSTQN